MQYYVLAGQKEAPLHQKRIADKRCFFCESSVNHNYSQCERIMYEQYILWIIARSNILLSPRIVVLTYGMCEFIAGPTAERMHNISNFLEIEIISRVYFDLVFHGKYNSHRHLKNVFFFICKYTSLDFSRIL